MLSQCPSGKVFENYFSLLNESIPDMIVDISRHRESPIFCYQNLIFVGDYVKKEIK